MDRQANNESAAVEDESMSIDEELSDTEEHAGPKHTPPNIKEASNAEAPCGATAVETSFATSQSTESPLSDEDSGYYSSRALHHMKGAVRGDKPMELGVTDSKAPVRRSSRLRQASTKADSNEISKILSSNNAGKKSISQAPRKSGNKNKVGKKGHQVAVKSKAGTRMPQTSGTKSQTGKSSRVSEKKPQTGRKKSQASGNRSQVDSKTRKRVTSDSVTSPNSDSFGISKSSSVKRKASESEAEIEAQMDGPITRSRRKMILDERARSAKLSE